MSDFCWHKGEPPKDGKVYLLACEYGFELDFRLNRAGRFFELGFWSNAGLVWKNQDGFKVDTPEAWAEIPPVDWDAMEEE